MDNFEIEIIDDKKEKYQSWEFHGILDMPSSEEWLSMNITSYGDDQKELKKHTLKSVERAIFQLIRLQERLEQNNFDETE